MGQAASPSWGEGLCLCSVQTDSFNPALTAAFLPLAWASRRDVYGAHQTRGTCSSLLAQTGRGRLAATAMIIVTSEFNFKRTWENSASLVSLSPPCPRRRSSRMARSTCASCRTRRVCRRCARKLNRRKFITRLNGVCLAIVPQTLRHLSPYNDWH